MCRNASTAWAGVSALCRAEIVGAMARLTRCIRQSQIQPSGAFGLTLNDDELAIYEQMYRHLKPRAPVPDLVIYLQADAHTLVDRVRRRGISHEQPIAETYLMRLTERYTRFFHHYDAAPLLIAALLWQLAHFVYPATWAFWAGLALNWDVTMIGWSLAAAGLAMGIAQVFVTGRAIARFGEARTVLIGMIVGGLSFLLYVFARENWQVYAIIFFSALQGLVWPSMNALLSRMTDASHQGALQGGMASIASIAAIFGPLAMTQALAFGAPGWFPVAGNWTGTGQTTIGVVDRRSTSCNGCCVPASPADMTRRYRRIGGTRATRFRGERAPPQAKRPARGASYCTRRTVLASAQCFSRE